MRVMSTNNMRVGSESGSRPQVSNRSIAGRLEAGSPVHGGPGGASPSPSTLKHAPSRLVPAHDRSVEPSAHIDRMCDGRRVSGWRQPPSCDLLSCELNAHELRTTVDGHHIPGPACTYTHTLRPHSNSELAPMALWPRPTDRRNKPRRDPVSPRACGPRQSAGGRFAGLHILVV